MSDDVNPEIPARSAPTADPLDAHLLPAGVRSRCIDGINGLGMHCLEAGFETPGQPLLVLLHGFPELAYSWRKVMTPLAAAGYHVIAPDQRGYGRTLGWSGTYDGDIGEFRLLNLVRDVLGLVAALGCRQAAAVIGHDFGSPVAAWCALVRPDVFRSVALLSAPFSGPPELPFNTHANHAAHANHTAPAARPRTSSSNLQQALAGLSPPRKHYHDYYSTPEANADMLDCPQGLGDFLRAYYHMKSADWSGNLTFPLSGWTADALALLPRYYVMDQGKGMAETVAAEMPSRAQCAACTWLTDAELAVYRTEFARTGFQGGLNWYRCRTDPRQNDELLLYSGRTIDVPSCFIAGRQDWGVYQSPGALESMQSKACTRLHSTSLIDGAGHWVQQEQAAAVTEALLGFLADTQTTRTSLS
ncbi:MAG: alpha/beta hydrolase [Pseudomonadales bacterium]|nr:alpha/beta fold hydrolase [Pseudomonadales bacterium]